MPYQLNHHIDPPGNEDLLQDIRETAAKLNASSLTWKQYKDHGNYYPSIFLRRFGKWNKALRLSGLQVQKQYNITREQLLRNLRKLWNELGRQPTLADLALPSSRYGKKPYLRIFGKWSNALKRVINDFTVADIPMQEKQHVEVIEPKYISWKLRHLVMKVDSFRCRLCGASPATQLGVELHVDHIIPVAKGGHSAVNNLQTLCNRCNIGKGGM